VLFRSGMSCPSSPSSVLSPLPGSHVITGAPMERSKSALRRDVLEQKNELGPKLVVIMVGLPARGKSYVCKKLNRYLSWLGFNCKVFNVGNRRRVLASLAKNDSQIDAYSSFTKQQVVINSSVSADSVHSTSNQHDANFFNPGNMEAKKWREQLALESLEELIGWLHSGGKIGILDATNSTVERRRVLIDRVNQEKNVMVLFIESICTEGPVLDANIEMKLSGPDYVNIPRDQAIKDFKERIRNYEKIYETLAEEEEARDVSYVKIINIGKKVITNNIHGYLQSHCVFYLMQLNIKKRTIWVTRHGESYYNIDNRIGGDPPLTENGQAYGKALGKFLKKYYQNKALPNISSSDSSANNVWTSTLKRTIETVESFDEQMFEITHIKFLNEIYAGICENLTYVCVFVLICCRRNLKNSIRTSSKHGRRTSLFIGIQVRVVSRTWMSSNDSDP